MKSRLTYLLLAIVAAVAVVAADQNDAARTLLEAARKTEVVDGDLNAAIRLYKDIADKYKTDHAIAANALLRMAQCYEKLGGAEARPIYERIVRDYADQKDAVVVANARLGGGDRAEQQTSVALRKIWTGDISGAVSPDGRFMTHVGNFNTALVLRDLTTGADRALTSEPGRGTYSSVFSKDGTQVAYDWCTRETCEVRIASLQGTGVPLSRRVFGNDEGAVSPMDWSPDGKWIAVSLERKDRTTQIGLMEVSGGKLRVLKSVDWRGSTRMFFSPDGRDIAFDLPVDENSGQRDVFVLAVDGSREVRAVSHSGEDRVMGWTPDGKHLLFASDRSGAMGLWAQAFAAGKPQGSAELVKPDIGNVSPLGIIRSGAMYLGIRVSSQDVEVASIDLATGKQTAAPVRPIQRFTGSNSQPAWSPDGKSLAYASARGNSSIVAVRSAGTGEIRELRPALSWFQGLSWSPDGRSFAVFGTDLKGRHGVFRIDADGGDVTPIAVPIAETEALSYEGFHWSPDRGRLYYHSQNGTVRERDLASGSERVVFTGRPSSISVTPPDGRLGPISLSPDGQWIASYRAEASGKSSVVVLIPVNGGEPLELLRVNRPEWVNNTSMPWTPDGRAILVRKMTSTGGETSDLWLVPIDGTMPRKLDFDVNRVVPYAQGKIRLHPDGRQIAFVSGQQVSEVWVLENVLPALTAKRPGSNQR